jgi:hypothetical protein
MTLADDVTHSIRSGVTSRVTRSDPAAGKSGKFDAAQSFTPSLAVSYGNITV